MRQRADALEKCAPLLKDLKKKEKALKEKEADVEAALQDSRKADAAYMLAKEGYFRSQAGLLAAELRENEPCPVCGSTLHPHPASLTDGAVTKEDMEEAEAMQRTASDALNLKDRERTELKAGLEGLKESIKKENIEPDASLKELKKKADALKQEAERIDARIADAGKAVTALRTDIENAGKEIEERTEVSKKLQEKEIECERAFTDGLEEFGFSNTEVFNAARMEQKEMEDAEEKIRAYVSDRDVLQGRVSQLKTVAQGQEPADLSKLDEEIASAEKEEKGARDLKEELTVRKSKNSTALQTIERVRAKQKKQETHWAVISELYRCCSGQIRSTVKLTFETYVQQYYFKQVVSAANKRLTVLTDGMFTLRCKEEAKDLRSQSGLDLEVLDRSTGMWRDVSTLSGGESFLASLALALGLSDIVQAQSGAIRIEAMFIDEGFGTLDDNALSNSVRVLSELAEGKRLIGIISHVHELEERIEHQIVVRKTARGSKVEMIC